MLRIQQIKLTLSESLDQLPDKIIKKLHISSEDLLSWRIYRESLDARRATDVHFTYCIDCRVKHEEQVLRKHFKDVSRVQEYHYAYPKKGVIGLTHRPVVVGFGPAGMFAALLLAQMGYCPLVIERGQCVEDRVRRVEDFWQNGKLDPQSNVQFGEGGAGTFSDGKLTTRSKDLRVHKVLEELVRFGAPQDILYTAHPHIGTDLLRDIVKRLREEIIALGGEVRFSSCLQDLIIEQGELRGIVVNDEEIPVDQLILSIGHSARDTYRLLHARGVTMHPKAFAIGARIEHPQTLINEAQYKTLCGHPRLSAAEYRLTHTASNGRGVYTFCMCPGGSVVPSTSMEGGVVVNGMSEHARDRENANSALLVQIRPEDYGEHALDGIAYQEALEKKAFVLGGGAYRAPAQRVEDFLKHRASTAMGSVQPSYALGVTPCDLHEVLPAYVTSAMEEAITAMDHRLKGFAMGDAVLTGVETRSSSPVRLERGKEDLQSLSVSGLYPCGEGAGYAGGIVSAAIDGIRCAEQIIAMFHYTKEAACD